MKKSHVILHGVNFELINSSGVVENMAFFHSRVVKARNGMEAAKKVVNLVKEDKKLKNKLYKDSKLEPELHVEDILAAQDSSHGNIWIFWPMDEDYEASKLYFRRVHGKWKQHEKKYKS